MTIPTSETNWVSSGNGLGYGADGFRGLEGKDAAFLSGDFRGLEHSRLVADVHRNSKEDVIQTLQTKFELANFAKDTQIRLESLQRETQLGLQVLRAEMQDSIRSESAATRQMLADSESKKRDQELLIMQIKSAIIPPVVP